MWAFPSQYNIVFTRGNELPQQAGDYFAAQNPQPCRENSDRITVHIQQVSLGSKTPTFLSITQLCPESDALVTLRNIRDGKVHPGEQIGMWKMTEPYSDPVEYDKPDTFRTRNRVQSRAAVIDNINQRLDEVREGLDRQKRTNDVLEQLNQDIREMNEFYNPTTAP